MSLTAVLDVVIGLGFLYLILSLVVSWGNEWIARLLNYRGRRLKDAIMNILKDAPEFLKFENYYTEHDEFMERQQEKSLVMKFYEHPLIKALSKEEPGIGTGTTTIQKYPSYIPAKRFASVALDVLLDDEDYFEKTDEELKNLIQQIKNEELRQALLTFYNAGARDIFALRNSLEEWYNDIMDRLSGWYKRRMHLFSLGISVAVAILFNIDTFAVTTTLWNDPVVRASVVEYVGDNLDSFDPSESQLDPDSDAFEVPENIQGALDTLALPIGWTSESPGTFIAKANEDPFMYLSKVVGWLFTGFAVSLGAPFWFETIDKVINFRSSGVVPEENR